MQSAHGANRTFATGTLLARFFLEPQNTIVISSSHEKPRRWLVHSRLRTVGMAQRTSMLPSEQVRGFVRHI
jgi:hypothetical protein